MIHGKVDGSWVAQRLWASIPILGRRVPPTLTAEIAAELIYILCVLCRWVKSVPFRTLDTILEPHPRLRSYPFLGQVCKKWLTILSTPVAQVGNRSQRGVYGVVLGPLPQPDNLLPGD